MMGNELLPQVRDAFVSLFDRALARPYLGLMGHQVTQRFTVVGNARTGSNYLLAGLKRSRSIRMYHEIFADHNRRIGSDFDRIFSTLYRKESRSIKIVGFKLFYNHLTEDEWHRFLSYPDIQVIHLTRQNRLRTVVSLQIAFKTGQWIKSHRSAGNPPSDKRILLEPGHLLAELERIEAAEAATRQRFAGRRILEVGYERLVEHPAEVFHTVGRYLGVDDLDPGGIRLAKQNPERLEQLIINYAEVAQALKPTRFAAYLEE